MIGAQLLAIGAGLRAGGFQVTAQLLPLSAGGLGLLGQLGPSCLEITAQLLGLGAGVGGGLFGAGAVPLGLPLSQARSPCPLLGDTDLLGRRGVHGLDFGFGRRTRGADLLLRCPLGRLDSRGSGGKRPLPLSSGGLGVGAGGGDLGGRGRADLLDLGVSFSDPRIPLGDGVLGRPFGQRLVLDGAGQVPACGFCLSFGFGGATADLVDLGLRLGADTGDLGDSGVRITGGSHDLGDPIDYLTLLRPMRGSHHLPLRQQLGQRRPRRGHRTRRGPIPAGRRHARGGELQLAFALERRGAVVAAADTVRVHPLLTAVVRSAAGTLFGFQCDAADVEIAGFRIESDRELAHTRCGSLAHGPLWLIWCVHRLIIP